MCVGVCVERDGGFSLWIRAKKKNRWAAAVRVGNSNSSHWFGFCCIFFFGSINHVPHCCLVVGWMVVVVNVVVVLVVVVLVVVHSVMVLLLILALQLQQWVLQT